MVESLNNLHKTNSIFYWCNCVGEVNMPGDGGIVHHTEDELPPAVKRLIHYVDEMHATKKYVVSIRGKVGLLLCMLHDFDWYEDNLKDAKSDYTLNADTQYNIIVKIVEHRANVINKMFDGVGTVFFGEETDPFGHEVCLFIPNPDSIDLDSVISLFDSESIKQDDVDTFVHIALHYDMLRDYLNIES